MLLDSLAYLLSHPIRSLGTVLAVVAGLFAFGWWIDRDNADTDQP